MGWTKEQKMAIDMAGSDLLVAAAAGSGKTAVLVERIIGKILPEDNQAKGVDIDRMLIVTFTRAAAAEMRERISDAIAKRLEEASGDTARLYEQQALLGKSYIMTLDSFCYEVVMKHFTVSGIDPSYSIAEDSDLALVRREAVEELLEDWYAAGDPMFEKLAETYISGKNDAPLEAVILKLYDFAFSNPDPENWLKEKADAFLRDGKSDFSETLWGQVMLNRIGIILEECVQEIFSVLEDAERFGINSYLGTLRSDGELLLNLQAAASEMNWQQLYEAVTKLVFPKIGVRKKEEDETVAKDLQNRRNAVKKRVQGILPLFGADAETGFRDMALLYPYAQKLVEVELDYIHRFSEKKKEKHFLEFSDVVHLAIRVLTAGKTETGDYIPSAAALAYREKFLEVYVDEYQDTNLLQETIIQMVSKGSNCFMVGDVKQSIYRFRNACPELFLEKHNTFRPAEIAASCAVPSLIKLSANFRSRKTVIEGVNSVFSRIMRPSTCGMPYEEGDALHYGAEYYDASDNSSDYRCELLIGEHTGQYKEGRLLFAEGLRIAAEIKKIMADQFRVYDKKTGDTRKVKYGDIVILSRSTAGRGEVLASALQSEGIPVFFEEKGGFFGNHDINIVLAFLKIIDNPLQDIPLLTVLRSSIFHFTDTEIARIRIGLRDTYFYSAVEKAAEDPSGQKTLGEKCRAFLSTLLLLREQASRVPISQLIWRIIIETGFYEYVGTLEKGEKRQMDLRLLFDKAVRFEKGRSRGFFRFLNYMEKLKADETDLALSAAVNEGMDVVRIMTIHKSKGLEFPVVFLSCADRKFMNQDFKDKLLLHKNLGFGLSCYDEKRRALYASVMRDSIKIVETADMKAEEMRLLYVAMTRAREKLYVTGCTKECFPLLLDTARQHRSARTGNPTDFSVLEAGSYLDWICQAMGATPENVLPWHWRTFSPEALLENFDSGEAMVSLPEVHESVEPHREVFTAADWKYPYDTSIHLPAKLSVSEAGKYMRLVGEEEDSEIAVFSGEKEIKLRDLPDFVKLSRGKLSSAEIGTLLHKCLQQVDLTACKKMTEMSGRNAEEEALRILSETVRGMEEKGFVLPEEVPFIDCSLLVPFFFSDIGRRLLAAEQVERELPFTLMKPVSELGMAGEGQISVQGIIDCCFIENDKYVVLDFKSDAVSGEMIRQRAESYRTQIDLYSEALQKITGRPVAQKILYFLRNNQAVCFD